MKHTPLTNFYSYQKRQKHQIAKLLYCKLFNVSKDVLIAATAMIKGLTVVSNDSDLTRVEGLS